MDEELREIRKTLHEHDRKLNALLKVVIGQLEQMVELEAVVSDVVTAAREFMEMENVPAPASTKQSHLN
jgi:transcriptional regulator of heat shock response